MTLLPTLSSKLVTFRCDSCDRTYRYGIDEGKDVPCECGYGVIKRFDASVPATSRKLPESDTMPTEEKFDLIHELVVCWSDDLDNNQRNTMNNNAGHGNSGLLEYIDLGLSQGRIPSWK